MSLVSLIQEYKTTAGIFDEMWNANDVREPYSKVLSALQHLDLPSLHKKEHLAGELFMNQGITFTVYADNAGIERIFPFDIIPRIITGTEWDHVEKGIQQRLQALNLFLKDIYNEQQILKDKIIPAGLIASRPHYIREVYGIQVPCDIY